MVIYRKILSQPFVQGPTTWTDIAGLSPIAIQAGQPDFSFIATLSISGLTVPSFPSQWQIAFQIVQSGTVLARSYMGDGNGPWSPQIVLVGVGDVAASGTSELVQAQWITSGVEAYIKEASSFSIVWDDRQDD